MVNFDGVTKRFPLGNVALNDVSFKIEDNDFVFLVGPSGAGKTTILKLLMYEYAPTSGTIDVNEFRITNKSFKQVEKLRRRIGMVFQDFKILPDKNVFENIAVSLQVLGTNSGSVSRMVDEALELVNLTNKRNVFPSQLSAGELQRVAIARAIIGDRSIILADEPTGNLDPTTTWEIMKIFKKLEGQKTVIIATHNTDIVNSMKKRVLVLEDGRLKKDLKKGRYEL